MHVLPEYASTSVEQLPPRGSLHEHPPQSRVSIEPP
jgi:hypothetical protein